MAAPATLEGLYHHAEALVREGRIPSNTAHARLSAIRRVTGALGLQPETDVANLDVGAMFEAFSRTKLGNSLDPRTRQDYRSRFVSALRDYLQFAAADDARPVLVGGGPGGRLARLTPVTAPLETYSLPLADNRIARLTVPLDLTMSDVERITTFLKTIPLEDRHGS